MVSVDDGNHYNDTYSVSTCCDSYGTSTLIQLLLEREREYAIGQGSKPNEIINFVTVVAH